MGEEGQVRSRRRRLYAVLETECEILTKIVI